MTIAARAWRDVWKRFPSKAWLRIHVEGLKPPLSPSKNGHRDWTDFPAHLLPPMSVQGHGQRYSEGIHNWLTRTQKQQKCIRGELEAVRKACGGIDLFNLWPRNLEPDDIQPSGSKTSESKVMWSEALHEATHSFKLLLASLGHPVPYRVL